MKILKEGFYKFVPFADVAEETSPLSLIQVIEVVEANSSEHSGVVFLTGVPEYYSVGDILAAGVVSSKIQMPKHYRHRDGTTARNLDV